MGGEQGTCFAGEEYFFLCAGLIWPGVGLASLETVLLGMCGVSRYVSRSPGVGIYLLCAVWCPLSSGFNS
jgi:hypothetical protein